MENITLNQLSYGTFEIARIRLSDDDDISIDLIKDYVHSTRSVLLEQKFNKNARVIDDAFLQSLGAVEIEAVDSSIHPTLKSGRFMFRTKVDIPTTITRKNYEGTFTRIGPADRLGTEYNLVSYNRAMFSGNGRFNKDMVFCFLLDNRIYLISNSNLIHKGIQFIDVIGVFENPSQIAQFKDSNGDSLYSDTGRYPISRTMADAIQKIILQDKFGIKIGIPPDNVNDGTQLTQ
jgi:hypothetical protein